MLFEKKVAKKNIVQQEDEISYLSPAASYFKTRILGKNTGDFIFENITRLFAFFLLSFVAVMVYEMVRTSIPSINKF